LTNAVVYTSPYVPPEWIAAHGLTPVRVVPDVPPQGRAAEAREGVCPYAAATADLLARTPACAVVLATTCDQMRRLPDLAAGRFAAPVIMLNVPHTWQTAAAFGLYISELQRLGRFMVCRGGQAPEKGRLPAAMARWDQGRARLRELRPKMSASRWARALLAFHRTGGVPQAGLPAGAPPVGGPGIALLGGPLPEGEFWLYDLIEQAGGTVCLDGTENGERTLPRPFDWRRLRDDAFGELCDAYFDAIRDVFQRPNSRLYDWLRDRLPRSGAQAVIVRHYVWCDLWRAEVHRVAESCGLPVLHLDGEGDPGERERTRTRVEALMETLRCRTNR